VLSAIAWIKRMRCEHYKAYTSRARARAETLGGLRHTVTR